MKVVLKKLSDDGIINGLKNSTVFRFFVCNLLYSINFWLALAYYPVYFNKLGISDKRIGILISVISFVTLVSVFPFGVMSDRFLPKTLLRMGAFMMALGNLLIIFFNNFFFIFAIVMLVGIGSTLFIISLYSLYYKQLGDSRRGIRIALFTLGTALGFGIGPFIGGITITYLEIKWVFIFSVFLNLILLFLISALKSSVTIKFRIDMYRKDLQRPEVLFLIILVFVMSSHFGVEKTCITLLMSKTLNLTGIQIGTIFMFVGTWVAVLSMVAGHYFDKTKRIISLVSLSILVSGFFQMFTGYASSFSSILIVRLLHTVGDSFFLVLKVVLITMIFPNQRMGGNFGFIYSVNTLATTVAALFSGVLSDHYGYRFPFVINGSLMVAMAIMLLAFKGRIGNLLACHSVK